MPEIRRLLVTGPSGWPVHAALVVRVVAGAIVAGFGVGKFTHHRAEADALDRYGIPYSDLTTYWVGVVELGGGLLLVAGLLTRPVALALAVNFVVAIPTAGRLEGGAVHLGLAPALLLSMLFLLWAGPGARSLDRRLFGRPFAAASWAVDAASR